MQCGALTVGVTAVIVPVVLSGSAGLRVQSNNGMRLLSRTANSGNVYIGTTSAVTTSTGNLVSKGDPGTTLPYTIPSDHFSQGGTVYLIADGANQVVDWSFD